MFNITWDMEERRAGSAHEVDLLLDQLQLAFTGTDPALVTVEFVETGDSLSIGLGRERSVLNYIRGDKDPPYYTSSGGADDDEAVSFRFGGDWSEFPPWNAVPIALAREAMRHFCETGKLSNDIQWEEV